MLKKLLLVTLLGVSLGASAQTNFRPGYVVTLGGDTLRGEVDARGAVRNARLARFRPTAAAAITDYQPRQLRGYCFVGDRVYQAETVLLADSAQSLAWPQLPADTLARHSFLEVVVRGELSLLYLRDQRSNDHYYVQLVGQPVQELIQKISLVTADLPSTSGTVMRRKSDHYRYTLAAVTQHCLPLQPAVAKVNFDLRSLTGLIEQYNKCVGSAVVMPATATRKNHVQLGLIVGAETSHLTLKDGFFSRNRNLESVSNQISPVVGLALNLQLTGINKALSVRVEGLYESQEYLARQAVTFPTYYDEYRVKLSSIRVPLQVRYTYPRGAIRPFAQVGLSLSHFFKSENEIRKVYIPANPAFRDKAWRQIVNPRTLERGALGGIGLTTARANQRNAALELRYERSDGFSDDLGFSSRLNRFYLLLSYDLTK